MANRDGVNLNEALQCVGEGWHFLVKHIYAEATKYDPEIRIVQVKEKFGKLRVYWDSPERKEAKHPGLLAFCDIVWKAEADSGKVCEMCGKPGRVTDSRGWLMCRCPEHSEHSI